MDEYKAYVVEDRGIGRNILKKVGMRDSDDNFEDAVNAANKKKPDLVLRYINRTIDKKLDETKRHCYWLRIDALDELIDSFAKWEKKNPKRYGEFFKIVKDELDRMKKVQSVFRENRKKFNPDKEFQFDGAKVGIVLSRAVEALVDCAKSEYVEDNERLLESITTELFFFAVKASAQSSVEAGSALRGNAEFMKLWNRFNLYKTYKRNDENSIRILADYIEHGPSAGNYEKKDRPENGRWSSSGGYSFS